MSWPAFPDEAQDDDSPLFFHIFPTNTVERRYWLPGESVHIFMPDPGGDNLSAILFMILPVIYGVSFILRFSVYISLSARLMTL